MSNDVIKISRSSTIEKDRSVAVLRLNSDIKHIIGQPVMVRYYDTNPGHVDINVVLALGIKEGYGQDCYRIISAGQPWVVRDVTLIPPGVSMLTHQETYVFLNDVDNKWYLSYLPEGEVNRVIKLLEGGPYKFLSLEDNYIWFFKDGVMKKEDEFLTKNEISILIEEAYKDDIELLKQQTDQLVKDLDLVEEKVQVLEDLANKLEVVVAPNNTVHLSDKKSEVILFVKVYKAGIEITTDCLYTFNGVPVTPDFEGEFVADGIDKSGTYEVVATEFGTTNVGTGTVYLRYGYNSYIGVVPDDSWQPTEENILNLPYQIPTDYYTSVRAAEMSLENQKVVVVIPTSPSNVKLMKIIDRNSLDYFDCYDTFEIVISGIKYDGYMMQRKMSHLKFDQECVFNVTSTILGEFTSEFTFEYD